jgi:replicative DNA helicase
MRTGHQLLEALDARGEHDKDGPGVATVSTGFTHLDHLTGGLRAGHLWVITSAPGHGRTTLLTQWVAQLALTHRWRTWLSAPREHEDVVAARILASMSRVPVLGLLADDLDAQQRHRVTGVRELLRTADLQTTTHASGPSPSPQHIGAASPNFAALIDDADLVPTAAPGHLIELAEAGALVIVTLPRHMMVEGPLEDADLDPQWARAADVVVEVRTRGLVPGDVEARLGEADLRVLRHRHGPVTTSTVGFQPHYARFVDMPEEPMR